MSSFKLRPRFRKISKGSVEEHREHFQKLIDSTDEFNGTVASSMVKFRIAEKDNHYWSPELTLMLEEHEKGTLISGLYSPKSSVWTLFAFAYGTVAMLLAAVLIWGGVEWQMNNNTDLIYTGVPVLLGVALVIYLIAQLGQKIGAEQMFALHHFFEDSIRERVHIE